MKNVHKWVDRMNREAKLRKAIYVHFPVRHQRPQFVGIGRFKYPKRIIYTYGGNRTIDDVALAWRFLREDLIRSALSKGYSFSEAQANAYEQYPEC